MPRKKKDLTENNTNDDLDIDEIEFIRSEFERAAARMNIEPPDTGAPSSAPSTHPLIKRSFLQHEDASTRENESSEETTFSKNEESPEPSSEESLDPIGKPWSKYLKEYPEKESFDSQGTPDDTFIDKKMSHHTEHDAKTPSQNDAITRYKGAISTSRIKEDVTFSSNHRSSSFLEDKLSVIMQPTEKIVVNETMLGDILRKKETGGMPFSVSRIVRSLYSRGAYLQSTSFSVFLTEIGKDCGVSKSTTLRAIKFLSGDSELIEAIITFGGGGSEVHLKKEFFSTGKRIEKDKIILSNEVFGIAKICFLVAFAGVPLEQFTDAFIRKLCKHVETLRKNIPLSPPIDMERAIGSLYAVARYCFTGRNIEKKCAYLVAALDRDMDIIERIPPSHVDVGIEIAEFIGILIKDPSIPSLTDLEKGAEILGIKTTDKTRESQERHISSTIKMFMHAHPRIFLRENPL